MFKKKKLIEELVNKISIEKNEIKTKLLNIFTLLFLMLLFDASFFTIEKLNPNKRISSRKLLNACLKPFNKKECLYGRKIYSDNKFDKSKYYFVTHI